VPVSAANNTVPNEKAVISSNSGKATDASRKEKSADKSTDKENQRDNGDNNSNQSNQMPATDSDSVKDLTRTITKPSQGVFFRLDSVQFGGIEVGTLTRVKLELCNATNKEVSFP
jgi:hypothetical protein